MYNNYLVPGRVIVSEQAVPTVTPDGLVSWKGSSMAVEAVQAALAGAVVTGQGFGVFPLGSLVSGQRGAVDLQILLGAETLAVAATGTIVTVAGSLLVDATDTFTLHDGVNSPTVFEFDSGGGVTPPHVAVAFTGGDSIATVRTSIVSAINGVGSTLRITASPGTPGQVLLVNDLVGAAGNIAVTETVADPGFTVSGMSGGVTAGPETTIFYITDSLTSPTNYIELATDNLGRPLLRITNAAGTKVAETTPSGATLTPGAPLSMRMSWDSAALVPGQGRSASLTVNQKAIPDAEWTTNPTTAWAPFQPAYLVVGQGLGAASAFTGTLSLIQASNAVLP